MWHTVLYLLYNIMIRQYRVERTHGTYSLFHTYTAKTVLTERDVVVSTCKLQVRGCYVPFFGSLTGTAALTPPSSGSLPSHTLRSQVVGPYTGA